MNVNRYGMSEETREVKIPRWMMDDMFGVYYRSSGRCPCILDKCEYNSLPEAEKNEDGIMGAGRNRYSE